jgi:hypothetical protein
VAGFGVVGIECSCSAAMLSVDWCSVTVSEPVLRTHTLFYFTLGCEVLNRINFRVYFHKIRRYLSSSLF